MQALLFFFLCIFLSIKLIDNSQCQVRFGLVGRCGCCSYIGGNCIYYETIDGIDVSWHVCVPNHLKKTFSLEQCKPKLIPAKNYTRICRTSNGTFRLFPQCTTKEICFLPTPSRNSTPQCHTQMAVKGSCEESLKRFSYDSKRQECVPFIYSGCGGTTNRFIRKERCEKLCIKTI
ncbi:unnamed protein product [Rotaria sordida]|uniref:BPTI/Kunitz inhibitor domain-containing protein n=1 Tax=Rotaria sordida TaxID=392033 RepID=A0A818GE51_9BILA|nr:unnamed protein product [Rotaria sordida]CAF0830193.1 unnamed protein product [Rotaria sordida]CAF0836773.1 unnamed protein product [Rotaria sordida]CAF0837754.1 unnamed protein product [Rotaria sordida]CAF0872841.1 unnamed protein product [Rotaria sordida]